jgi:tripartite-type tricarboxylate transporter receptor subunit TctC
MTVCRHASLTLLAAAIASLSLAGGAADAQTVEQFYAGRTLTMIVSTGAGGGYDASARIVAHHMERHIPGHPTIVVKNMPGAGHAVGARYVYNVAPQDGSTLASLGQNLPMAQLLDPDKMKFRMEKLNWIGNVTQENNVTIAWSKTGITSFKDLMQKELIVGVQGVNSTSAQFPLAMSNVLGARFRLINGFSGTQTIILAMERGEVSGLGSIAWATVKARHPDWISQKKAVPLVQIGTKRLRDLPDVPLMIELGRNAAEKQVFEMLSSGIFIGRPILTTPNVPADRVAALRKAFDDTVKDPAYLADAKKAEIEVDPVPGAEVQAYVEKLVSASPDSVKLLKAALSAKKIFDCDKLVKDKALCEKPKKGKKKQS